MSAQPRARSEGVVSEEVGDELMVYDKTTQTAHALSTEASSVWRLCDGRSSAKDIARRAGLEQARVAEALEQLSAAGLIEEPEGISRRALYKRTAKLGAAALSGPLIYSVAIRPPSAAASPLACDNLSCVNSGDTAAHAKANADALCKGFPNCTSTSTCSCTPFEVEGGIWTCSGTCQF